MLHWSLFQLVQLNTNYLNSYTNISYYLYFALCFGLLCFHLEHNINNLYYIKLVW
jgi:hypothetical protein